MTQINIEKEKESAINAKNTRDGISTGSEPSGLSNRQRLLER